MIVVPPSLLIREEGMREEVAELGGEEEGILLFLRE